MTVLEQQQQAVNSKRLAGKVALVTGGSRGIGASIAQRLAEEGATVAITYSKNKSSADSVVSEIAVNGGKALAVQADANSEQDVDKLVKELERTVGKIDILVNNAGVFEALPIDQIDLAHYQRVFDVNVKGVVATTVAALKLIPDGGRIINISSVVATKIFPGASIYAASKAALSALTRTWAQDLGKRRITVNDVAPGTTATDMYHSAIPSEQESGLIEKTALGRIGEPSDIAAVVAFLASSDSGWITGQSIVADGGLIM